MRARAEYEIVRDARERERERVANRRRAFNFVFSQYSFAAMMLTFLLVTLNRNVSRSVKLQSTINVINDNC